MVPASLVFEGDWWWFFLTLWAKPHKMSDLWLGLYVSRKGSWMLHFWRNFWKRTKLLLCLVVVEVVLALLEEVIAALRQSMK